MNLSAMQLEVKSDKQTQSRDYQKHDHVRTTSNVSAILRKHHFRNESHQKHTKINPQI